MDALFAFCVLQFILDTSLFNKIFTNHPKSVILFYSEVFFSQPSFLEFPILELYRKLLVLFSLKGIINVRQNKTVRHSHTVRHDILN